VALGALKQRALLAILLLQANSVISVDRLIDALWDESPPETAQKALQVYVSGLRRALGRERLETTHPGYRLRVEPQEFDLACFDELRRQGRPAEALALWRGPPLAEFAALRFAQAEIARLEELRLSCVEERVEQDLAAGREIGLVAELEGLVRVHPLRQRLRGQLMRALHQADRDAEALEVYRQGRDLLVEELGIEPSRQLRELQRAILRQDAGLEPAAMDAATPAAHGVFVGRETELTQLWQGFEHAVAGRGRLFLLVGEPGIGKSWLAEELANRAKSRGARVAVGRCWEAGGAPAFWPWVQSLREYVADLSADTLSAQLGDGAADLAQLLPELRSLLPDLPMPYPLEPESARFRLFESVAGFLRRAAAARPIVLVLDDVHAADESSLLLLQFLSRQLGDSRLLILVAYRDVDPTIREPLAAVLPELAREPTTSRLELGGLRESEVGEYISQTATMAPPSGVVAEIHAQTDGNPLFVGEVTRLLLKEGALMPASARAAIRVRIPQGVRDVIGRRLRRLPHDARQTLTLASVLGREFRLEVLARVAESSEEAVLEALDPAITERIVDEVATGPGQLRFSHVLIRDCLYRDLTPAHRLRLHRAVAEALEAVYADQLELHLGELAHHYAEAAPAGDVERAITYARRAGDRAADLLAFEEAARLYLLAIGLIDGGDFGEKVQLCELLIALGDVQARAGDMPSARESFLHASELADEVCSSELLARAALGYGGRFLFTRAAEDDRVVPLLERARTALPHRDSPLRVRVLTRLGNAVSQQDPVLSQTLTGEALQMARRLGDPATRRFAIAGWLWATRAPTDLDQRWALTAELIDARDKEVAFEGHALRSIILLARGDIPAIRREFELMRGLAGELGQPSQRWWIAAHEAALALLEGRLTDAETAVERARQLGDRAQSYDAANYHHLQRFVLRRQHGRVAEVLADLEHMSDVDPERPLLRCARALAQHDVGREAEARIAYQELARDQFAVLQVNNDWLLAAAFLSELNASVGTAEEAAALYERLVEFEQLNVDTYEVSTGAVSRYLGLLAARMGQLDDAERHYDHALAFNERMGAGLWLAHTQRDYAALLLARHRPGDVARAEELRRCALSSVRSGTTPSEGRGPMPALPPSC
jgi:DNA-binding SARP family transcriptional activator/tetratricopeptide (TPR) repeat protein